MKIGGIYEIVNTANGRRYIGSAVSLEQRQGQHFRALARDRQHNRKLQAAWNKHGAAAFEFHILMICFSSCNLIPWEQRFLDEFRPEYNLSPTAGSPLGTRHSLQSRANMSAAQRGQIPEVLAKMAAARRGRPLTPDHRAKISAAHRGKTLSLEHKEKMLSANRGRPLSLEHRAKLRAANLGRRHTPEARAKISAAKLVYWSARQ